MQNHGKLAFDYLLFVLVCLALLTYSYTLVTPLAQTERVVMVCCPQCGHGLTVDVHLGNLDLISVLVFGKASIA